MSLDADRAGAFDSETLSETLLTPVARPAKSATPDVVTTLDADDLVALVAAPTAASASRTKADASGASDLPTPIWITRPPISAEHTLATLPGTFSLEIEQAKTLVAEIARLRAPLEEGGATDPARLARLLCEEGAAWEKLGDYAHAYACFEKASTTTPVLRAAIEGARRTMQLRAAAAQSDALRPGIFRAGDADLGTAPPVDPQAARDAEIAALEAAERLATTDAGRADLRVARARMFETIARESGTHDARAIGAYRSALLVAPRHAEALRGLEAALVVAYDAVQSAHDVGAEQTFGSELAAHYAALATAYAADFAVAASYLASRARVLQRLGDQDGAEEAYVASLTGSHALGEAAIRRATPVRDAYRRQLARRGSWGRLRDSLAEEARAERNPASAARLFHEAARISEQRLEDGRTALALWSEAAKRACDDAVLNGRIAHERTRLLEAFAEHEPLAHARRTLITLEADRAIRERELLKLAATLERIGNVRAAVTALGEARAIDPLRAETIAWLDRLYVRLGEPRARVDLWLERAANGHSPEDRAAAYVRAAQIVEQDDRSKPPSERRAEAIELLRAAWASDPEASEAFDGLARLLSGRSGKGGDAREATATQARALVELHMQAAHVALDPERRLAHLGKAAAILDDELDAPARAAELFGQILDRDPHRRSALLGLQRAHERAGDLRGLARALEREADQSSDVQHARELRLRAARVWSRRVGDGERAAAIAQRLLRASADDEGALEALQDAHEVAGRVAEVVALLRARIDLRRSKPDHDAASLVDLWLQIGDLSLTRLGDHEGASTAYAAALAIEPKSALASRSLAEALRARGAHEEVATLLERAAINAPTADASAAAWTEAAELWEGRVGDDMRAHKAFASALEKCPNDLVAWDGLARIAERRGASVDLEQALRVRIDGARASFDEGARDFDAREKSDRALDIAVLQLSLADLLVRRGGEVAAAVEAIERALTGAPGDVRTLRMLEAIRRQTRDEAGLAKALTALAHATQEPLARRGLLWELVRLQERGVGSGHPIAAYLLLYEIEPGDEAALAAIARLAGHEVGRRTGSEWGRESIPDARAVYAFALKQQTERARDASMRRTLQLRLADLLEVGGPEAETREALRLYLDVLAEDPESPTACAGVRRLGGRLEDAAAMLVGERAAAAIAPDLPTRITHLLSAASLSERVSATAGGGADLAAQLSIEALRLDPDSAEAAAAATRLLMAERDEGFEDATLERTRKLVDAMLDAAGRARDAERIVSLARTGARVAQQDLGDFSTAIALLQHAERARPNDVALLTELGLLLLQQRAWAEAARALDAALPLAGATDRDLRLQIQCARADLFEGALIDAAKAVDALRDASQLASGDAGLRLRLGSAILRERGADDAAGRDEAEAIFAAIHVDEMQPLEARVDALGRLSDAAVFFGDIKGAEAPLREALALDPELGHAAFAKLEEFHATHGDGDASLALALEALTRNGEGDPRWLQRLGELEVHRLGKSQEGVAHLRAAALAMAAPSRASLPSVASVASVASGTSVAATPPPRTSLIPGLQGAATPKPLRGAAESVASARLPARPAAQTRAPAASVATAERADLGALESRVEGSSAAIAPPSGAAPIGGHDRALDAQLSLATGLLRAREGSARVEEAAQILREIAVRDPAHARALETFQGALTTLGKSEEASVVGEVRAYFGFDGDSGAYRGRRLPPTGALRGGRIDPIDDVTLLTHVLPEAARITPLEVLGALSDQLGALFPCDLSALGLTRRDRVQAKSAHPFRAHVDRAASLLNVREVDLYVHDAPEPRIFVDFLDVPALFVPSSISALPELEIAFAIGRLVARVATGTYTLDKLNAQEVEELVYAAVAPYGAPLSAPRTKRLGNDDDLTRKLQRVVSRKSRKHLEEIAPRVTAFDGARFVRGLAQAWSRIAYLTTGDLTSALDHLRRYDEVGLADMGATEALPGDLLRFALGADAARLRRQVGSTWV